VSSPRLNSFAKRTQREVVAARQRAFDRTIGQTVRCESCGAEVLLTMAAYRGVAMRDRVQVEAVRYACDQCGTEFAVRIDEQSPD
jgi:DNA-directed RNA polymerase subunit RPC12/RpoP